MDISSATNRLTPYCYFNYKSKTIANVTQQGLKLFDSLDVMQKNQFDIRYD